MDETLRRAERITGCPITALTWAWSKPLPAYRVPAAWMVRQGRAEEVLKPLEDVEPWGSA